MRALGNAVTCVASLAGAATLQRCVSTGHGELVGLVNMIRAMPRAKRPPLTLDEYEDVVSGSTRHDSAPDTLRACPTGADVIQEVGRRGVVSLLLINALNHVHVRSLEFNENEWKTGLGLAPTPSLAS